MKAAYLIILVWIISSCQPGANKEKASDAENTSPSDPCALAAQTLNGTFSARYMEGTMTWKGGTSGTVEIEGVDYNDIICSYTIPDCNQTVVSMNCDGGLYNASLIIYSVDSFLLDQTGYRRIQ